MRIAEFDWDEVLRNAMEAFRAKGYAKTTMQELVAATGLPPFTAQKCLPEGFAQPILCRTQSVPLAAQGLRQRANPTA